MDEGTCRNIVVIGGSSGSTPVLRKLLKELPADLPAAIFITTHVSDRGLGLLVDMLGEDAALPLGYAVDGQPIEKGRVYLAVPDRHLMLTDGAILLGTGPRENMVRPAIDALFRSAALYFGGRVIGLVLSGLLDDGASGLGAIKARGGMTVVQHPLDAAAPDMPLAALQAAQIDHVVGKEELAETLVALVGQAVGPSPPVSEALRLEVEIAAGAPLGSRLLGQIAKPVPLTCPQCQGTLSEMRDAHPLRYRCQIGHAFTAEMLARRTEEVEAAIRMAMRIMEERVTLVERMAEDARATGRSAVAELYEARVQEYRGYAATLREAATASMRDLP